MMHSVEMSEEYTRTQKVRMYGWLSAPQLLTTCWKTRGQVSQGGRRRNFGLVFRF